MREILFRGKRANNKEWVEGGIIPLDTDSGYIFIAEPFLSASTLPVYEIIKHRTHLVIPETVGQFTGLTDKNGKKIFEGDIVQCYFADGYKEKRTIRWSNQDVRFLFVPFDEKYMWGIDNTDKFEVIGNIHDNPELLKGGTE